MDTKQKLIETIQKLLSAKDMDLGFLNKLQEKELKTLVAIIREKTGN